MEASALTGDNVDAIFKTGTLCCILWGDFQIRSDWAQAEYFKQHLELEF